MMKLDPRKQIPPKIEEAVVNVINMNMKNSSLPNNSIQLNTGGSQPLTLTPISVAGKDSDVIAKRTLRARTKQSKDVLQMISGKSEEATAMQTSHLVQNFDVKTRQKIIEGFKSTVSVPADHVAAMLDKISTENKDVFLLGDYNMDPLKVILNLYPHWRQICSFLI